MILWGAFIDSYLQFVFESEKMQAYTKKEKTEALRFKLGLVKTVESLCACQMDILEVFNNTLSTRDPLIFSRGIRNIGIKTVITNMQEILFKYGNSFIDVDLPLAKITSKNIKCGYLTVQNEIIANAILEVEIVTYTEIRIRISNPQDNLFDIPALYSLMSSIVNKDIEQGYTDERNTQVDQFAKNNIEFFTIGNGNLSDLKKTAQLLTVSIDASLKALEYMKDFICRNYSMHNYFNDYDETLRIG